MADTDAAAYVDASVVIDEATNRRLLKMVNRRILPLMCLAYLCQALDKSTTSTASIMGLRPDTWDYALTSTLVWVGIIVGEFPANRAIQVFPAAKLLGSCMIIWGLLLLPSGLILDYRPLFVFRFLLGFFESVIAPCLLAITVMWYKKSEQPLISASWQCMLGANNAISGLLGYAFFHVTHAALKSWQILFLIVAAISIISGVIVIWQLPDSPARATMYSEEDKKLFVERVRSNDQGIKNKVYNSAQAWEVAKDPAVWMYFLLFFQNTLVVGGIGTFGSILINGSFGFSVLNSQLLNIPLGALSIFFYFLAAWMVTKTKQTILVMFLFTIPSIIGTIVLLTVPTNDKTRSGLLFSFYLMQSFGAQNPMITGMLLSRNVAGQTKKTYAYAITFLGWAGGNAIAPQIFQAVWAPRYINSLWIHIAIYAMFIVTLVFTRILLMRRNAIKERAQAENAVNEHLHAFEDLMDLQNPDFRYALLLLLLMSVRSLTQTGSLLQVLVLSVPQRPPTVLRLFFLDSQTLYEQFWPSIQP
ncbi:major facilitator superfamily domain-containing protein [Mycena latifolia]|nr:major facilitator superfamily domain-containing protein [Mycena latifolia]